MKLAFTLGGITAIEAVSNDEICISTHKGDYTVIIGAKRKDEPYDTPRYEAVLVLPNGHKANGVLVASRDPMGPSHEVGTHTILEFYNDTTTVLFEVNPDLFHRLTPGSRFL